MSFLHALTDEIGSLESELEADPRFVKLRELRRIHRLYAGSVESGEDHPTKANTEVQSKPLRIIPKPKRRGDPRREVALAAAIEVMTGVGEPVKTGDLWELLADRGLELGGDNPQNNFSSLLYKSGEFVSFGRSGWLLKSEAEKLSTAQAAGASDQPFLGDEAVGTESGEDAPTASVSQPVDPLLRDHRADPSEPGREVEHDNIS